MRQRKAIRLQGRKSITLLKEHKCKQTTSKNDEGVQDTNFSKIQTSVHYGEAV